MVRSKESESMVWTFRLETFSPVSRSWRLARPEKSARTRMRNCLWTRGVGSFLPAGSGAGGASAAGASSGGVSGGVSAGVSVEAKGSGVASGVANGSGSVGVAKGSASAGASGVAKGSAGVSEEANGSALASGAGSEEAKGSAGVSSAGVSAAGSGAGAGADFFLVTVKDMSSFLAMMDSVRALGEMIEMGLSVRVDAGFGKMRGGLESWRGAAKCLFFRRIRKMVFGDAGFFPRFVTGGLGNTDFFPRFVNFGFF